MEGGCRQAAALYCLPVCTRQRVADIFSSITYKLTRDKLISSRFRFIVSGDYLITRLIVLPSAKGQFRILEKEPFALPRVQYCCYVIQYSPADRLTDSQVNAACLSI